MSRSVVTVGEPVEITATFGVEEREGERRETRSYTIQLKVNGTTVETKTVAVEDGNAAPVAFTYRPDRPGSYPVELQVLLGAAVAVGTLEVRAAESTLPTPVPTATSMPATTRATTVPITPTTTTSAPVTATIATTPPTAEPAGKQVAWHLSKDVMPVPPYGSQDIRGSDTASKLYVQQRTGTIVAHIQGAMKGLKANTKYWVNFGKEYQTQTTYPGLFSTTIPPFSFDTDNNGVGTWSLDLGSSDLPGTEPRHMLSVWVNDAASGATILISDNFEIKADIASGG